MDYTSGPRSSTWRLILVPAVVTLAITLLRLYGELHHWSKTYFNPQGGGGGAIVGITWLAPVFGVYFAIRLAKAGEDASSLWKALGFSALGAVVLVFGGIPAAKLHVSTFHGRLVYLWINWAVAGILTLPGWRALWKVMLAYAYAARIPVAIIMFFAFQGNWGTHYDAAPPDLPAGMSVVAKWVWLGLIPQLTFWVGYTLVAGMLLGSLAAGLQRLLRRQAVPAVS